MFAADTGTTTDLVPQLLGMFDELARGKAEPSISQEQQHVALQKRLSLVQKRKSSCRVSQLYACNNSDDAMAPAPGDETEINGHHALVGCNHPTILVEDKSSPVLGRGSQHASPTSLRYSGRRCRSQQQPGSRPVSGSSIASSTSSSGCSNQGNASSAANPYLASVESLADTCASSQGSGDSGVVTISESSGNGPSLTSNGSGTGRPNGKIRMSEVDRATAARFFDERRPRYCDPHRSPVERVLLEIVDTEAVYVEHLRQVIQGYLIFWRDDPASLIRDLELNGLFSNIEDIFEFNRNFLSALDSSGLDPIAVANTFIEHNSGFKVYTEYCTNYPTTVSILTELMSQEEIARAFRERQAALGHLLPLGSFLLKPVQRILKYHLLLENLSKEFEAKLELEGNDEADNSSAAEGRAALEGALQAMTGIARHINAMKRKHEHAVRVQEIQSLLYGWPGPDLTTSGELIAEGSFRMRGAKAPRHAFLFDRMLLLTKKREDGLLVYKAHILCSNLTLMESIPGEPLSFHVIPFDNSQLQYKLQARNLEQKREWTLQIKRVILENYNAVIPSHARQLVLQIGQNRSEDDATPERYKKSSEYFDSRKADRERRRSETGLRQKLKKGRKSDVSIRTAENSPMVERKNQSAESIHFGSRDENLNRSSEIRGSKIKDRFTSWRRKSEPGFQSYINLNPSDHEETETVDATANDSSSTTPTQDLAVSKDGEAQTKPDGNTTTEPPSPSSQTKEPSNVDDLSKQLKSQQSVEEIVGNILMNSQEFQRRLDKQHQQLPRNHSVLHDSILKQRIAKSAATLDSSEEEDTDNEDKATSNGGTSYNKLRSRFSRREQCFVRAVNAYNQRSFRSQYDSFRNVDTLDDSMLQRQNSSPAAVRTSTTRSSNHEKRSPPESFKKPNFGSDSRVIRTALRIRENCCDSGSEHEDREEPIYETPTIVKKDEAVVDDKGNLSNYDNLQHAWHDCLETDDGTIQDCPTKAAVWLTKLCEGLPDQPQKCGSLPRSFQMMNATDDDLGHVSKSRFLQRDGKSMTERPFTIASDKPAEINLEDMERYASTCQGSARIAKFPTGGGSSTSSSTFFCSLDDASFTDTDSMSRGTTLSSSTHVHPDHKIYRANRSVSKDLTSGTITPNHSSSSIRSVLSKAGSRLQGLRSSQSTEALECSEEIERTRYFRSFSKRGKNKNSIKSSSRDTITSDVEEVVGCVVTNNNSSSKLRLDHLPYHKQGSSSLGARIAQSDYADPIKLFAESRRNLLSSADSTRSVVDNEEADDGHDEVFETVEEAIEALESDSFYEKSFETIENYVEGETEETFRDSAIFSDVDDSSLKSTEAATNVGSARKVPPPVPQKRKLRRSIGVVSEKPAVTQKPAHLKLRARIVKCRGSRTVPAKAANTGSTENKEMIVDNAGGATVVREDDVSSGQSQVGWVKKMVGQLQAQVDA
ncbi:hypothetical protein TSAR_012692 [Trichomalopsis sarcophagae]|uniref:DH domain-containing protein n=1 Tax=Trichomalopsis sarcophagae TaxID=543379 RepID=A0A232FLW9_9HYME|nr:hypothetical protein TSAR_012692 [Trichomalopsis sarcophagae]